MRKGGFILQILLGLWSVMGAWYMMGHYMDLGSAWALGALPAVFWTVLGVVQIVLAVVLILSVRRRGRLHRFATSVALALAVISLAGSVLYSAYSGFPGILWALIPAALFGLVAFKKSK
jgi:heme/copper-type cytochrome/quinol oxidase subunit 4